MKLTTKTRYGTRAMVDLAQHWDEGLQSTRDIAQRQEISPKYLEHLLSLVRDADLVESVRGAHGGHRLARPAEQIILSEIYVALEGPDAHVACADCPEVCDRSKDCVTREVWKEMFDASMKVLQSQSLAQLAGEGAQESGSQSGILHAESGG